MTNGPPEQTWKEQHQKNRHGVQVLVTNRRKELFLRMSLISTVIICTSTASMQRKVRWEWYCQFKGCITLVFSTSHFLSSRFLVLLLLNKFLCCNKSFKISLSFSSSPFWSIFVEYYLITHCTVYYQPIRQVKKGSLHRKGRAESASVAKNSKVLEDKGENIVDGIHKVKAEGCQDFCPAVDLPNEFTNTKMLAAAGPAPLEIDSVNMLLQSPSHRG